MLIHLTNDEQIGAMSSRLNETEKMDCQYELQFGETLCRKKNQYSPDDIKANSKYCNGVENKIDIWFRYYDSSSVVKKA